MGITATITELLVEAAGGVEAIGVTGVVAAAGIASVLTDVALMSGVSLLSSLLSPKPGNNSATIGPVTLSVNPTDQRAWCYGRFATGGVMKYAEPVGSTNQDLWAVVQVHDTQCDGFENFIIDNQVIEFSGHAATPSGNLSGTVTSYSGNTTVNGASGTTFTKDLSLGAKIIVSGQTRTIASIVSDGVLTTTVGFNPTVSGQHYQRTDNPYYFKNTPYMWRYDMLGNQSQSAEPNIVAASATGSGEWDTSHAGKGVAYFSWHLLYNQQVYSGGIPSPLLVLRGRKLWDPRLDDDYGGSGAMHLSDESTWVWSQNAALALLDYLIGPKLSTVRIGGCGVPVSCLDLASFRAAANICDQSVSLANGQTQARYTINGFVGALEDKSQVVQAMLLAMGGTLIYRGGLLTLLAGAAISEVDGAGNTRSLSDDDLCGPISIYPTITRQDKVNYLTSTYPEPTQNFAATQAPDLTDSTYITADGGLTLQKEINHRFTTSLQTVSRLNALILANFREQLTIDGQFKAAALRISAGDTFIWTSAATGYSGVKMFCQQRDVNPDGSVRILARQETDAKYSWSTGQEQTPPNFLIQVFQKTPPAPVAPMGFTASSNGAVANWAWNDINNPNLAGYSIFIASAGGNLSSASPVVTGLRADAYSTASLAVGNYTSFIYATDIFEQQGASASADITISSSPSGFAPFTDVYNVGTTSGTEAVPVGAGNLTITVDGPGYIGVFGSSFLGYSDYTYPVVSNGGSGGGRAVKNVVIDPTDWGKTLSYVVGDAATAAYDPDTPAWDQNGWNPSTVTASLHAGSISISVLDTSTGGDSNTTGGNPSGTGNVTSGKGVGGAGASGATGGTPDPSNGSGRPGSAPGGAGSGASSHGFSLQAPGNGADGQIVFEWKP